jgi:hypothetical protein
MRQRTNVYLDVDQLTALKLLAVEEHVPVADLVRQAVDQLLHRRLSHRDRWGEQFDGVLARLRSRLPADARASEIERDVDESIQEARQARHARGA